MRFEKVDPMGRRVHVRKDRRGVTEIIGTMLILAMTVVLFSAIILWVNSFPPPRASTRLDFEGSLSFDMAGGTPYANITIVHKGGDILLDYRTDIFLQITASGGGVTTEEYETVGTVNGGFFDGEAYGLADSNDDDWSVGEHWNLKHDSISATDTVRILVADTQNNVLLWDQFLRPTGEDRPPLFLEKYADRTPATATIDLPMDRLSFRLFGRVTDLDGDLNEDSVWAILVADDPDTPVHLVDDGTSGDITAGDGLFTSVVEWTPLDTTWDGTAVRFNATDDGGRELVSWMILEVETNPNEQPPPPCDPLVQNCTTGPGGNQGLPQNFICNGDSCYNIFKNDLTDGLSTEDWNFDWTVAVPTRVFTETDEVVVAILTSRIKDPVKPEVLNNFYMYDPFATKVCNERTVYGAGDGGGCKTVGGTSKPSNTDAFRWDNETNTYFLYVYCFRLNHASQYTDCRDQTAAAPGAGNFVDATSCKTVVATYCFTQYSIFLEIKGSLPIQDPPDSKYFQATDQITIKSSSGYVLTYPDIATYTSSTYSTFRTWFLSTDTIYVAVNMSTVDGSNTNVRMGNVIIKDFLGNTQVNKAPGGWNQAVSPVCPVSGACTGNIFTIDFTDRQYQFRIDLGQVDQDPWLEGNQTYTLSIIIMRDFDENYTTPISIAITVKAPIYKMDLVEGNYQLDNSAWGTKDVSYFYDNLNALDRWSKQRIDEGSGPPAETPEVRSVKFGNLDTDTDLDIAEGKLQSNSASFLYWYRRGVDANQNTIWTRSQVDSHGGNNIKDLDIADLTRDGFNEIIAAVNNAGDSSHVGIYYYRNDGSWTRNTVDTSGGAVLAITTGDYDNDGDVDIAAARNGKTVSTYRNDGFGTFTSWVTITLATVATFDAVSIDTGKQDADAYDDLVVGASNGNVYRLYGGPSGVTNGGVFASPTGSVVGVKLGEFDPSSSGLELAALSGTSIRIYRYTTTPPASAIATLPVANTGSSLAAGDFDDDGDDDLAASTTGTNIGAIYYYRNRGSGSTWDSARTVDNLGEKVFDLDCGDADKGRLGR